MKASYLDQSGNKVVLTQSAVQKLYDEANDKFFGGILPEVPIKSVASRKFFGCISYKRSGYELKGFNYLALSHSVSFAKFENLLDTLVHEMIHVWQYYNSPYCLLLKRSHGVTFKDWSKKINQIDPTLSITQTSPSSEGVTKKQELYFLVSEKHNCFIAFKEKTLPEYEAFKAVILRRFSSFRNTDFRLIKGNTTCASVKVVTKLINRKAVSFIIKDIEQVVKEYEIIEKFTLKM